MKEKLVEKIDDVVTPDQFVEQHPQFRKSQLIWMFRNRERNGLKDAGAVLVIGKKFYINKPRFTVWLQSQIK